MQCLTLKFFSSDFLNLHCMLYLCYILPPLCDDCDCIWLVVLIKPILTIDTKKLQLQGIPYSLKFLRINYFAVLPNSAQKQFFLWIKFSWSSFQPHLASVMNLKFRGRNFSRPFSIHEIHENFQPRKF